MAKAQQKMTPAKSFLRQDPRLKKIPDACPFQIPRCRSSRCWMKHSCSNFIKSASRMIIASLLDDCAMMASVKWPRSLLSPFSSPFSLWASGFTPVKTHHNIAIHNRSAHLLLTLSTLCSGTFPLVLRQSNHVISDRSSCCIFFVNFRRRCAGARFRDPRAPKWEPFEATHTHTHTHTHEGDATPSDAENRNAPC
jgi:hypothetical protein